MYQYGGGGNPRTLAAFYLADQVDAMHPTSTSQPLHALPLQTWTCVEWQFDGVNDELRFWLDGQLLPELTETPTQGGRWPAPAFERLDLGLYNVRADVNAPVEMWIDDVALGMQRIGCEP